MALFLNKLAAIFRRSALDALFWSELEETLLEADVGVEVTEKLMASVRGLASAEEVRQRLSAQMLSLFPMPAAPALTETPRVILIFGVNGAGKTTTIAKLAYRLQGEGRQVLLVAADTYRAAAVEQLRAWGERLALEVVARGAGADAAAVAFDGVAKASAQGFDAVLIDTAGRLHTKANLMEELKKVCRVAGKALPGAPHERLLVIDATVGGNGLAQARDFHQALSLTGVVVAKLDGTAKGGVVLAIAGELGIPITDIGMGEKLEDLREFSPDEFVGSIVG